MDYSTLILKTAKTLELSGIAGRLLLAICTHESGLTNVVTVHDNGSPSYGLCQLKLATAQSLGFKGNPHGELVKGERFKGTMQPKYKPIGLMDPATNSKYAALYLKYQLERYQNNCKAVAAFNSGSYKESKKYPGKPQNLKYVKQVAKFLTEEDKELLDCK